MVFYLFCRYGHLVSHPFIALLFFLHLYSTFDFENSKIDLGIALDAYSEMITADPTLEMKYQYRAQSTAASVQSLLASCVGVDTTEEKAEAVPVAVSATDDHPKSKQHHPCPPPHVMVDKIRLLLSEYRSRYEATIATYARVVEDDLPTAGHAPYGNESNYHYSEDPRSGSPVLRYCL